MKNRKKEFKDCNLEILFRLPFCLACSIDFRLKTAHSALIHISSLSTCQSAQSSLTPSHGLVVPHDDARNRPWALQAPGELQALSDSVPSSVVWLLEGPGRGASGISGQPPLQLGRPHPLLGLSFCQQQDGRVSETGKHTQSTFETTEAGSHVPLRKNWAVNPAPILGGGFLTQKRTRSESLGSSPGDQPLMTEPRKGLWAWIWRRTFEEIKVGKFSPKKGLLSA